MTSRRPMTRSYSGNGRMGSQNGDDVSSPRLDSRNYLSNVRPENRSTFCTVMAQLTEETQPCFETTIKSKAVSETCNVKFSCVVTGYPVPELTWYKDDTELDRYCGLPKYEIFRNGKTHTLHIYNCTEEDAAIYQASARNSKGIVSCSGVLEVGHMNEYEIHQRFFSKLKQKAELKRRELEGSRHREKENVPQEGLSISPDRSLRKRRLPEPLETSRVPVQDGEDFKVKDEGKNEETITAPNEEINGISPEAQRLNADISDRPQLNHVHEKAETENKKQPNKEKLSRKKIRISNGFDEGVSNEPIQSATEKDSTHEGTTLAKYLAESLQSQVAAEQQRTMMQTQELTGTDTTSILEGVKESERELMKVEERESKWSRDREKNTQLEHRAESKVQEHKEPEPQHKSALSSVFSSLKGIFFGKSKKAPTDMNVEKDIPEAHSSCLQTQEQEFDKMSTTNTEHVMPMDVDQPHKTVDLYVNRDSPQPARSLHFSNDSVSLNLNDHTQAFSNDNAEIALSSSLTPHVNLEATMSGCPVHEEEKRAEEEMGAEALVKSYLPLAGATDNNAMADRDEDMVKLPHETAKQECAAPMDQVTQAGREMPTVQEPDDTADLTPRPEASLAGPHMTDPENLEKDQHSQPVSHVSLLASYTHENEKEMSLDKNMTGHDLQTEEVGTPAVEETEGACGTKLHEGFVTNQGSEDEMNAPRVDMTDHTEKTHTVTAEEAKQPAPSLNQEGVESSINLTNDSTQGLDMSQMVSPLTDSSIECDSKQNEIVETSFVESEQKVGEKSIKEENGNSVENKQVNYIKDDSTEEKKAQNVEEKQSEGTQDRKVDRREKIENVLTEENKNGSLEQATAVEPELSKYTKPVPFEGIETLLSPGLVDKPKIPPKSQPERNTAEFRDQSVIPPIIILPDTRETVIKNVAKMRATPVVPEIKVTVAEKAKREEPSSIPRIDVLVPEPERVMQPLAQEVAHLFRDNEPKTEEPTSDAIRTPKEIGKDDRVVTTSESVGVTPTQPERNVDLASSDLRNQEVKPQNLEARVGDTEEPVKSMSGWSRGNDSTIPLISIACADDVTPSPNQEPAHGKPALDKTVVTDNIATSSTTHTESSATKYIRTELAPDSSVRSADGDLDLIGRVSTFVVIQEQSDKRNVPEAQPSTDMPFPDCDNCDKVGQHREGKLEPEGDRVQRDKPAMDKLGLTAPVGPTLPPLSPASLRRLMAKNNPNLESQGSIPAPSADGSEKKGDESGGSTPTSNLSCESSPKMKRRDSLTLIPSATPEELASGARRKIYLAKTKSEDEGTDTQNKRDSPYLSPSQARRAAFLQLQSGQQTPPMERRSPLLARRKATLEVPKPKEESSVETEDSNTDSKPTQKEKLDPFKAPQVIRKIRGEPFSDASGHLKLWCQFFNVLSDSTIKWFRDEEEILELKRSAGDESPVALAIVQASSRDCGVYGCTIKNEYGTDTTDYLLSADILAEFFLRDDLEVGEEIEMTPLLFTKGLADPGYWGDKFFGRIMTEEVQIGEGYERKTSRAKVIYGLDPVFESGSTCIAKVKNPIAYGTKEESGLTEKNLEVTRQECKIQNTVREYCKIFAAEARVIDNFGFSLEVIPLYLMYRPANTIPYASVEADLQGQYLKYCTMDSTGRLISGTTSEVEQKCCTFQHWIYQWTNCNLLVTRLEGVETKITNIRIVTKSKGYQGLTDEGSPQILEQFVLQHQCNYYCGLLGLRPLKPMDSLQQPKAKTSRSPLLARRASSGSSSPQLQKKASSSPLPPRKGTSSPKVAKKTGEDGENKPATKHKTVEVPKTVRMR